MGKAILTISKLTDRKNGYGMAIVEVNSTEDIKVMATIYNLPQGIAKVVDLQI